MNTLLRVGLVILVQHFSYQMNSDSAEEFRRFIIANPQRGSATVFENRGRLGLVWCHTAKSAVSSSVILTTDARYFVGLGFSIGSLIINWIILNRYRHGDPPSWRRWAPWIWVFMNGLETLYYLALHAW